MQIIITNYYRNKKFPDCGIYILLAIVQAQIRMEGKIFPKHIKNHYREKLCAKETVVLQGSQPIKCVKQLQGGGGGGDGTDAGPKAKENPPTIMTSVDHEIESNKPPNCDNVIDDVPEVNNKL